MGHRPAAGRSTVGAMRLRARRRAHLVLAIAIASLAAGCHSRSPARDARSACGAEVCVNVREVSTTAPLTALLEVQAPPGTRLRNAAARAGATQGAPCGAGVPVAFVAIDDEAVTHGPTAIDGRHELLLAFPRDSLEHAEASEKLLELDLSLAGQARCTRVRLIEGASAP